MPLIGCLNSVQLRYPPTSFLTLRLRGPCRSSFRPDQTHTQQTKTVFRTSCFSPSHPPPQSSAAFKRSRIVSCSRTLPAMTSTAQSRLHSGHSHSHQHHHDSAYLTSANKKDAGVRITRIGLYVNLGMAIGKGIGGYYFNSQALVADAFHSLTDLVSDFMTLATVSWSLKPPTARFPSGYGKVESLGSLGVSGLLLTGGVLMGLNACEVLYHQFFVDAAAAAGHGGMFGHGHSHNPANLGPNINAAWLAAGSIVVKEYLYRASMYSTLVGSIDIVLIYSYSYEDCEGTQILRPCLKCCPSSDRLSYQYRSLGGNWRLTLSAQCNMA